jgi:acetyl/propionyl-CoA carboxylase alpha subunit
MSNGTWIANRSEVVCHVVGTARKVGIATMAVYAEVEKQARPLALAAADARLSHALTLNNASLAGCTELADGLRKD